MQRTIPLLVASIGVAVVALGGCAGSVTLPEPPKEAMRDTLIVPRVRVGPAALGMTEANMLEWLGEPEGTLGSATDTPGYMHESRGLTVWFNKRGRASLITVSNSRYATADGISVGASIAKLRTAWGPPVKRKELAGPCADSTCKTQIVDVVKYCFSNGMQANVRVDTSQPRVAVLEVRADGCGF